MGPSFIVVINFVILSKVLKKYVAQYEAEGFNIMEGVWVVLMAIQFSKVIVFNDLHMYRLKSTEDAKSFFRL